MLPSRSSATLMLSPMPWLAPTLSFSRSGVDTPDRAASRPSVPPRPLTKSSAPPMLSLTLWLPSMRRSKRSTNLNVVDSGRIISSPDLQTLLGTTFSPGTKAPTPGLACWSECEFPWRTLL